MPGDAESSLSFLRNAEWLWKATIPSLLMAYGGVVCHEKAQQITKWRLRIFVHLRASLWLLILVFGPKQLQKDDFRPKARARDGSLMGTWRFILPGDQTEGAWRVE